MFFECFLFSAWKELVLQGQAVREMELHQATRPFPTVFFVYVGLKGSLGLQDQIVRDQFVQTIVHLAVSARSQKVNCTPRVCVDQAILEMTVNCPLAIQRAKDLFAMCWEMSRPAIAHHPLQESTAQVRERMSGFILGFLLFLQSLCQMLVPDAATMRANVLKECVILACQGGED